MEFTPQDIWKVLLEKFDDRKEFSQKFSKRKAWEKKYYNLDTYRKRTCIVVDYSKTENRLELDIYFFERREEFDKLYAQRDLIKKNENVELSYEVRTERTQGIYLKRYDIKPEGDREYLEELVEWIQNTALLLCYINERYNLELDVSRPEVATKQISIHEPMLPEKIIEEDNDYSVICGRCGQTFQKAQRCTFCGQTLKWPKKEDLGKFL
jgi:hypothetical protein